VGVVDVLVVGIVTAGVGAAVVVAGVLLAMGVVVGEGWRPNVLPCVGVVVDTCVWGSEDIDGVVGITREEPSVVVGVGDDDGVDTWVCVGTWMVVPGIVVGVVTVVVVAGVGVGAAAGAGVATPPPPPPSLVAVVGATAAPIMGRLSSVGGPPPIIEGPNIPGKPDISELIPPPPPIIAGIPPRAFIMVLGLMFVGPAVVILDGRPPPPPKPCLCLMLGISRVDKTE